MLLGKHTLNTTEVLISMAFIDSHFSHDEFVSVNNVLRQHNDIKEEIKKSENFCRIYYIKIMEMYSVSSKRYTANENSRVRKK